ncbi:luciferase family protein [Streptomyces sp. NBC_00872]|uniref:luciferase domain-containing protein n=2 Tax=unclassified Streptomyces TaxID=2593676 RepID=UPI00386ECB56
MNGPADGALNTWRTKAVRPRLTRARGTPQRRGHLFSFSLSAEVVVRHAESMNAARHAGERLMTWPGLSGGRAYCGTDPCVRTDTQEIVHFHGENEADVHLTNAMIAKLRPALKRSTALRLRAGCGWVTVRLDTGADIDLLATLVSAALQAVAGLPGDDGTGVVSDPCTRQRAYAHTR